MNPIDLVLSRLENVRRSGNGWTAKCPAHEDHHNSLAIHVGEDGRVLLHCFAGCTCEEIMAARGLEMRDLFPEDGRRPLGNGKLNGRLRLTVADLACDKKLPEAFLRELGVVEEGSALRITYRRADGSLAPRQRIRTALTAKEGSYWTKGAGDLVPYGLWRLEDARSKGYLVLVEGESDCWTLLFHGFPALGIPGADMAGKLLLEYLEGIRKLYIFREPDHGGEVFVAGIVRRLRSIGWAGDIYVVTLPGAKDPNELHQRNSEGFKSAFQAAMDAAKVPSEPGETPEEEVGPPPPAFELEPFPVEVLPAPLVRFVREVSQALPCPPDFVGVPMLAVLGAAIGTSRVIQVKPGWEERPLLYVAVVADPGSRKSPALDKVTLPLREYQKRLHAEYEWAREVYWQELSQFEVELETWKLASKKAAQGKELPPEEKPAAPEEPVMAQIFTTDATLEALAVLLQKNPRGLIFLRDELTGWVHGMNQYKSGRGADRQAWLSFWNGAQVVVNRKSAKGPVLLDRPFVSVVGCLPPDVLGDLADERGREDGFIHRLLFSYPEHLPPYWTEAFITQEAREGYLKVFEALLRLSPSVDAEGQSSSVVVPFTAIGREVFVGWANAHHKEQTDPLFPENLRGPWAKLEGYCARLALILQACRYVAGEAEGEAIDEVSALGAAALVDYFKSHARKVYARLYVTKEDKQAELALRWIRKQGGKVTAREVLRYKVAGVKTKSEAENLLKDLEERGHGTLEEKERRKIIFTLSI